jgi:hypothetical protein
MSNRTNCPHCNNEIFFDVKIEIHAPEQPEAPKLKFISTAQANAIYAEYPKKQGKSAGIRKLLTIPQDKHDRVVAALHRYRRDIKKKNTEAQFIRQFSTWARNWEDYDDPDAGKVRFGKEPVPETKVVEQEVVESNMTPEEIAEQVKKAKENMRGFGGKND